MKIMCKENRRTCPYVPQKETYICMHWEDSTAGDMDFQSFIAHLRNTTGILLAQLRNHGTSMQGPGNALYWSQKAIAAADKISWATTSYFFDEKWWAFLVRTAKKDRQINAWNLTPISITDSQNNLAQLALTPLCFCSLFTKGEQRTLRMTMPQTQGTPLYQGQNPPLRKLVLSWMHSNSSA